MIFRTFDEFHLWLERHEGCILDGGSQGMCYKIGNKVYKIFLQFIDEIDEIEENFVVYDKDSLLQFSSIVNNSYVFPKDVIMASDMVVGYITDYVEAKSLHKTNPLSIDLDIFGNKLEKVNNDIKIISDNGVISYDVIYNILYGNDGFKVIDTMEYARTDMDSLNLYRINKERFNYEIRLFLIDGYFDDFINSDKTLYSLCYDKDIDIVDFLRCFRKKLSEYEGYKIRTLGDAKKSMLVRRPQNMKYVRLF